MTVRRRRPAKDHLLGLRRQFAGTSEVGLANWLGAFRGDRQSGPRVVAPSTWLTYIVAVSRATRICAVGPTDIAILSEPA